MSHIIGVMDSANLANILGALALRLSDEMRAAVVSDERDATGMAALVHLSKYPGESIEGLRVPLELSHSGGVRLVDRLVNAGHVERHAGVDARSVALRLTRKGREVTLSALARRQEVLARALRSLPESERGVLGELVSRLLVHEVATEPAALRTCRLCNYVACRECPITVALGESAGSGGSGSHA